MKVIELFAGIGSQRKALNRLGIDHEVVAIVEWDKYAYQSYQAVHGPTLNLGDIKKVEQLPKCDLLTYSFPCQDLSVAGKGAGIKEGTRSGLLYEVERLLNAYETKPKYLLLENVKNLVGKQHKPDFDRWLQTLEQMGYNNYWQVLNAKHYGIPQNRERVFVVSVLKEFDNGKFQFPQAFDNGLRLKDFLESEVDEKYYISEEKTKSLIAQINETGKANTNPSGNGMNGNVHTGEYSPTLTTNKGEGLKIVVKEATKQGYAVASEGDSINLEHPNSKTRRGRVGVAQTLTTSCNQAVVEPNEINQIGNIVETDSFGGNPQRGRIYSVDGISPALNTCGGGGSEPKVFTSFRIRKLTPKECWRLMGFDDEDFEKAAQVCSNSQLYKQAGNSIVVNVLEHIFDQMFNQKELLGQISMLEYMRMEVIN